MRKVLLFIVLLGLSTPAQAQQDMLDLQSVHIVNAPDVRNWTATTSITQLSFDGAVTRINFTKRDGPGRWPDVTPPGWSGPLEYTLWLFVQVNGQWVGSGFIQFWNGRDGSGSPSDPDVPSVYDKHWYYSPRWIPIYGHGAIVAGERIGFMVTSGNARDSVGPYGPQERSNVVVVAATDNGQFSFASPPAPSPMPEPAPQPSPAPLPSSEVLERLVAIETKLDGLIQSENDFHEKVGIAWKSIMTFVARYGAPVVAGLVAGKKF